MSDSGGAIVVRSAVPAKTKYGDYQAELQRDFWYSCAYCSMTEIEAYAIPFSIDHFLPRKTHPELELDYGNLMWACRPCNSHKGAFDPSEDQRAKGQRLVRIDKEDPRRHFHGEGVRAIGDTPVGRFTIDRLELNRQQLRRMREIRQRLLKASEMIAHGAHVIMASRLDQMLPAHRASLLRLRQRVGDDLTQVNETADQFIRSCLGSPYNGDAGESAPLKQYLDEEGAVVPGTTCPLRVKQSSQKRRSGRRRR